MEEYKGFSQASATASVTANAIASASGSSTKSATATSTATSTISQENADILAYESALTIANQTALSTANSEAITNAYNNALEEVKNQLFPNEAFYIAILFNEVNFYNGLDDVINLIKSEFPTANVIYEIYIVDGSLKQTDDALQNFVTKYPSGQRATISGFTSVLNETALFFEKNNLDIFSLSVNSTSLTTQKLKNVFTYAYFLTRSVSSSFLIIKDYAVKNIVILFDKKSVNKIFLTSYYDTIIKQNSLLDNLPLITYELDPENVEPVYIPPNSCVYVLADTIDISTIYLNKIKNSFINNTSSYLYFTNLNNDIRDIFDNIPAMVAVLRPNNFTSTTIKVYNNFKNKKTYFFGAYAFYDILYTLNYMQINSIPLKRSDYLSSNPFGTTLQAYSNALGFNSSINGFDFGSYDIIFVKDVLINDDINLYDKYNAGGVMRLTDSQSIFKTVGLVPFFSSKIFYVNEDYYKIYENETLKYVKFDFNETNSDDNTVIMISETNECKFIVSFDSETGLLTNLIKLFDDKEKTNPEVNLTMSKYPINKYI
jgi:hypothetical protein